MMDAAQVEQRSEFLRSMRPERTAVDAPAAAPTDATTYTLLACVWQVATTRPASWGWIVLERPRSERPRSERSLHHNSSIERTTLATPYGQAWGCRTHRALAPGAAASLFMLQYCKDDTAHSVGW
jgi:hypothetical protein